MHVRARKAQRLQDINTKLTNYICNWSPYVCWGQYTSTVVLRRGVPPLNRKCNPHLPLNDSCCQHERQIKEWDLSFKQMEGGRRKTGSGGWQTLQRRIDAVRTLFTPSSNCCTQRTHINLILHSENKPGSHSNSVTPWPFIPGFFQPKEH